MDRDARKRAQDQRHMVTRPQLLEDGASGAAVWRRVRSGQWTAVQDGVYQVDARPRSWKDDLLAAVFAAGADAAASHRAALVLWDLDGISAAPVEITVPHSHGPLPEGTIVHRTRRPVRRTTLGSIPVTIVERTLLDCAAILREILVTKAVESALRKRLTTVDRLRQFINETGGRGVKGTRLLRRVLEVRSSDTPTGSGGETEALHHIRQSDIPEPVLQKRFTAGDGSPIKPDFFWPTANKAVEIDGIDAHDSADKLDHDLQRQNKMMDLGIELRRFSARLVRRDPDRFVREVRAFLSS